MIINSDSVTNKYFNPYALALSFTVKLPIFQREFSWKEEQTEALLNQIKDFAENDYGYGKEIYLLDFIGFEENNCFNLADGQQRLVALSILIKCLLDYASSHGLTVVIKNFDIYYENVDAQAKWQKFCNGNIVAPFKKVYIHMKQYIEDNSMLIHQIEDVLMNHLRVYIKYAENADDAFEIFEQINTGGKPLTKDEIIRTIIRQYSERYNIDLNINFTKLKAVLTSYCRYCSPVRGTFTNLAIMSFLNKQVVKDRDSFLKFQRYIYIVDSIQDLPVMYIAKMLNRIQLQDIICTYELNRVNLRVNRRPVDEVLLPLFLLCSIFSLTKVNPGGKVKGFLDSVLDMVRNNMDSSDIAAIIINFVDKNQDICTISFDNFIGLLKGSSNQKILKALLLMDVLKSNTSGSFTSELINLEHIYPQNPDIEWSRQGYPVNKDDQDELVHDIGNFLLLNEAVNKRIKNKYITYKRVEYDRIIPNDQFLQTRSNTVDFDRFEHDGKSYISERRALIAAYIYSDFPCGKVFIKK